MTFTPFLGPEDFFSFGTQVSLSTNSFGLVKENELVGRSQWTFTFAISMIDVIHFTAETILLSILITRAVSRLISYTEINYRIGFGYQILK